MKNTITATPATESIFSQGQSFDVLSGIEQGRDQFKTLYNYSQHVFVREIRTTTIEDQSYRLYESYVDSGSVDYYYFAVKF